MDVVRDLVVVRVSKTKAASESLVDRGVEENERIEERKCDRIVVLPEPDSPLMATCISTMVSGNLEQPLAQLTEKQRLGFRHVRPVLPMLDRRVLLPPPLHYHLSLHLVLWQTRCMC